MNKRNFLLVGHITRDIDPNGEFIPGGPVTYAGITLAQRGHNVQILTKAAQHDPLLDIIRNYGISIQNLSSKNSNETTTYTNIYDEFQNRTQTVSDIAESFTERDLDFITDYAAGQRIMVLPVANEIPPTFYEPLSDNSELLISAPQGSLRRWDNKGHVFHEPFTPEYLEALRFVDLTTISNEDMEGFSTEMRNQILFNTSDTVILTNGRDGAAMYHNNEIIDIPPFRLDYETEEKEGYPTGNGDHMTAIIAEGAPTSFGKHIDPENYKSEMYQAAAQGAFLTALKIMKREGVTDGVESIRTPTDVEKWTRQNRFRVHEYAELCKVDHSLFMNEIKLMREGNPNRFSRK